MLTLLLPLAMAAPPQTQLTWDLSVAGTPIGTRTVTVKFLPGEHGTHRVVEAFTEVRAEVGRIPVKFRQRMTAHADGGNPASFHSVVEDANGPSEVQGRWTPAGWVVSTNINGRTRSNELPTNRIHLSTADLMDPESRVGLHNQGDNLRMLSAITGEVHAGPLERLGPGSVTIDGKTVNGETYAWTSPEGRSTFLYTNEGYLAQYEMAVMGLTLTGVLQDPPPGGADDFPVAAGRPKVEVIPL